MQRYWSSLRFSFLRTLFLLAATTLLSNISLSLYLSISVCAVAPLRSPCSRGGRAHSYY